MQKKCQNNLHYFKEIDKKNTSYVVYFFVKEQNTQDVL